MPPPLTKSHLQLTFLFKPIATINYHDKKWCNTEHNDLDIYFLFLKPLLGAYKLHLHILKGI